MEPQRKAFHCEIATPRGQVYAGEAVGVIFPARDGQMGVWAGMAPTISSLGSGALTLTLPDGKTQRMFVHGGTAQVNDDGLRLLADECTPASDLNPEQLWEEIQKARRMPGETHAQATAREKAVALAREKFRLAQEVRQGEKWGLE
jgi:F-type H+-transporting ATPase subunit epsilon